MPRGQPFTLLCQQTARLARPRAADLHVHTTASDGDYTPSQVVVLAATAGLAAVAITDHDTLAGVSPAVESARQLARRPIQVIPGVEVSAEFAGRGLHILGYFVNPSNAALQEALSAACARRRQRFRAYLDSFVAAGVPIPAGLAEGVARRSQSLGRRHLADLLVAVGAAHSRYSAFQKYILPASPAVAQSHATPADVAIRLIRESGGIASLAHPPSDVTEADIATLRDLGLNAVEVSFPAATASRTEELRGLARRLGLVVAGGSDCHGPEPAGRGIGAKGVSHDELAALRALAS